MPPVRGGCDSSQNTLATSVGSLCLATPAVRLVLLTQWVTPLASASR